MNVRSQRQFQPERTSYKRGLTQQCGHQRLSRAVTQRPAGELLDTRKPPHGGVPVQT
ncbi:hypothetical protein AS9A_0765 [Hoyosella subflava DQS3-9A1]|uniref:Uncharacterized protein n=1 Tax=Hoyosella subflava (strain DSM 45089 / JCM 17490 / NBRC 109087 / DQS3-9A1) TaxID=443218 RepID=F6ELC7_HOYSD|nr:hypothetical protein AS9A_0765 [Hoyosella subflava DQS3-9A1]